MKAVFAALAAVFGFAQTLWSYFFSPKKQKERADAEVDRAIATHDEAKINEILDRNLK